MGITLGRGCLIGQQPVSRLHPFHLSLYLDWDQGVAFRQFGNGCLFAEALDLLYHVPVGSEPKDPFQLSQLRSVLGPSVTRLPEEGQFLCPYGFLHVVGEVVVPSLDKFHQVQVST